MEETQGNGNAGKDTGIKHDTRLSAVVAYIPFLCFIALFGADSDEFTRAHGRQGLILLICEIIAIVMLLPIGVFFWKVILLGCIISAIAGIVAALSKKSFVIPIIGKWADKI